MGGSGVTDEDARCYERALNQFNHEEWDDAIDLLNSLPEDDPAASWLKARAVWFKKNPPPPGWAGEIQSLTK